MRTNPRVLPLAGHVNYVSLEEPVCKRCYGNQKEERRIDKQFRKIRMRDTSIRPFPSSKIMRNKH